VQAAVDRRKFDQPARLVGLASRKWSKEIMESVLNCGTNQWLVIASVVLIYGVLALGGAALVKYLFFTGHGSATA
jgi:hypothetical protein